MKNKNLSMCRLCLFALILIFHLFVRPCAAEWFHRNNVPKTSCRYMVCANDQKFILTDGLGKLKDNPKTGSFTILDFSVFPPKVSSLSNVPCSVIGPPTCVAVTSDEHTVIVAAAMKVDPCDIAKQIPDNRVSVIEINDDNAKIIKTIQVGNEPSSVTICGNTAYVSNRSDGSISILSISGNKVKLVKTVKVCEPNDSIAHIAISPDSKFLLTSLNKAEAILYIPLKGTRNFGKIKRISVGQGPYCIDFDKEGKNAFVANTMDATVSVLEISGDSIKAKEQIKVGVLPEGLSISKANNLMVISSMMHTTVAIDNPDRDEFGQIMVFDVSGKKPRLIQTLQTDRIPQTAIFSPEGKYLVVAGYEKKRLLVYKMIDGQLKDTGVVINVPGQPCSLRTAN